MAENYDLYISTIQEYVCCRCNIQIIGASRVFLENVNIYVCPSKDVIHTNSERVMGTKPETITRIFCGTCDQIRSSDHHSNIWFVLRIKFIIFQMFKKMFIFRSSWSCCCFVFQKRLQQKMRMENQKVNILLLHYLCLKGCIMLTFLKTSNDIHLSWEYSRPACLETCIITAQVACWHSFLGRPKKRF